MKHLVPRGLWIAFLAVLTGCTSDDDARQNLAAAAPNVVALTATGYALQAPDTVPAGWTTFSPGQSRRTSGPRPKWVRRFGGPGGTAPGDSSSVTQYLEPGSYVWICPVEDSGRQPHFAKGEFKPFVVQAAGSDVVNRAAAPVADVVVRLMDYSFTLDLSLRAGRHTVRVENAGVEPHDMVLMKLAPGKTIEDVRTWLNPERARLAARNLRPSSPSAA